MLQSVEAVYRDGKIEFLEKPPEVKESRVIVTFLGNGPAKPHPPQFTPEELADLRNKFAAWEEDWQRPEMNIYDTL